MHLPRLHRSNDRTYSLVEPFNIGALRQYLEPLGFRHYDRKPGDLYMHRWRSPDGRSIVTLFPSGALVVLGPSLAQLDEIVECEVAR